MLNLINNHNGLKALSESTHIATLVTAYGLVSA